MKRHNIFFALAFAAGLGWALEAGAQNATQAAGPAAGSDPKLFAQLMAEGKAVFPKTCAACHGSNAGGSAGPALRQNLKDARGIVKAVANGRGAMPPVGAEFSDRQIAAIATYVRNSWGNAYGLVTEKEVANARKPVVF